MEANAFDDVKGKSFYILYVCDIRASDELSFYGFNFNIYTVRMISIKMLI